MREKFIVVLLGLILSAFESFAAMHNERECLEYLQNAALQKRDTHYISLVFAKTQEAAQESAKRDIRKQIALSIEANAILSLDAAMQQSFREEIEVNPLLFRDERLQREEIICKDEGDFLLLSYLSRDEVFKLAHKNLRALKEQNAKDIAEIKSTKNLLKKAYLLRKIHHDYLPYLMILQGSDLESEYFGEIQKIQKLYNDFYANTRFYVEIRYPHNRVYPVEERIDEVRHSVLEYLQAYKIFATKKEKGERIIQRERDIAVLVIELLDNSGRDYSYKLDFRLSSTIGTQEYTDQASTQLVYPRGVQAYQINFVKTLNFFHEKKSVIERLVLGE